MDKKTYDRGLEIRRRVLGSEYVDKALQSADENWIGILRSDISDNSAHTNSPVSAVPNCLSVCHPEPAAKDLRGAIRSAAEMLTPIGMPLEPRERAEPTVAIFRSDSFSGV